MTFTRSISDGGTVRTWNLLGDLGAVTFTFIRDSPAGPWAFAAVDYHWPTPQIPGEDLQACDILPGGRCWVDGSSCTYSPLVGEWERAGYDDEVIWRAAELAYRERLADE